MSILYIGVFLCNNPGSIHRKTLGREISSPGKRRRNSLICHECNRLTWHDTQQTGSDPFPQCKKSFLLINKSYGLHNTCVLSWFVWSDHLPLHSSLDNIYENSMFSLVKAINNVKVNSKLGGPQILNLPRGLFAMGPKPPEKPPRTRLCQ